MMLFILIAINLVYLSLTPQSQIAAPSLASDAAACLSPDVDSLRDIGYTSKTQFIPFHFAATGVPNSSMQGEPYVSVLFPSRSKRKALLLFVLRLPDGHLRIINEGYFAHKTSKGWETIEGNGGIGMYERVARFIADMERTPEYSLDRRIRASKSCISSATEESR
jgi:hypothetical protein